MKYILENKVGPVISEKDSSLQEWGIEDILSLNRRVEIQISSEKHEIP